MTNYDISNLISLRKHSDNNGDNEGCALERLCVRALRQTLIQVESDVHLDSGHVWSGGGEKNSSHNWDPSKQLILELKTLIEAAASALTKRTQLVGFLAIYILHTGLSK